MKLFIFSTAFLHFTDKIIHKLRFHCMVNARHHYSLGEMCCLNQYGENSFSFSTHNVDISIDLMFLLSKRPLIKKDISESSLTTEKLLTQIWQIKFQWHCVFWSSKSQRFVISKGCVHWLYHDGTYHLFTSHLFTIYLLLSVVYFALLLNTFSWFTFFFPN